MTSIGQTLGDDNNDRDTPINSPVPSWEEMVALLKQVSSFTSPEPPSINMEDFFPIIHRFFVDMPGNPHIIATHRLSHVTSKSILLYVQPM